MRVLKPAAVIGVAMLATSLTSPSTANAVQSDATTRADTRVISIAVKKDQVMAGKKVVVKGKVTNKKITRVKLQQKRIGTKWKTQGTTSVKDSGKYKIKDKTTTAVTRKYRVVSVTGPKEKSAKVTVGVFEWRDLTKLEARSDLGWYDMKSTRINSVSYGPGFARYEFGPSTGLIDFNVDRECIALRSRFGIDDDSDEGATATLSVVADGVTEYSKTFGLTQSEYATVDLDRPFRVGITYTVNNPSEADPAPRALVVAAEPEILCSAAQ